MDLFLSLRLSPIYKLGMYQMPYKSGISQFQPLQFSSQGVVAEGESETRDMLLVDGSA
jgi:hypothetical protein